MAETLITETAVAEFAVGLSLGVLFLLTLSRVPHALNASMAVAVAYLAYALALGGVPGLMSEVSAVVVHLGAHPSFMQGVMVGKLLVGLLSFARTRWRRSLSASSSRSSSRPLSSG